MRAASLFYRCRVCGHQYASRAVPDGAVALLVARGVASPPSDWGWHRPHETESHPCTDRMTGVADLIGVEWTPTGNNDVGEPTFDEDAS